jgi:hypothetical protein
MLTRGMIWLPPPPPHSSSVSKLDRRHTRRLRQLVDGRERGEGGVGEDPNHMKAWSSINNLILSTIPPTKTYLMITCVIFRSGTLHNWPGMLLTKWAVASTGTDGIYLLLVLREYTKSLCGCSLTIPRVSFMTGPKN